MPFGFTYAPSIEAFLLINAAAPLWIWAFEKFYFRLSFRRYILRLRLKIKKSGLKLRRIYNIYFWDEQILFDF